MTIRALVASVHCPSRADLKRCLAYDGNWCGSTTCISSHPLHRPENPSGPLRAAHCTSDAGQQVSGQLQAGAKQQQSPDTVLSHFRDESRQDDCHAGRTSKPLNRRRFGATWAAEQERHRGSVQDQEARALTVLSDANDAGTILTRLHSRLGQIAEALIMATGLSSARREWMGM